MGPNCTGYSLSFIPSLNPFLYFTYFEKFRFCFLWDINHKIDLFYPGLWDPKNFIQSSPFTTTSTQGYGIYEKDKIPAFKTLLAEWLLFLSISIFVFSFLQEKEYWRMRTGFSARWICTATTFTPIFTKLPWIALTKTTQTKGFYFLLRILFYVRMNTIQIQVRYRQTPMTFGEISRPFYTLLVFGWK